MLRKTQKSTDPAPAFMVFVVLTCCLVSSFFTDALGVHAIFGAFMLGLVTPHDHGFAFKLTEKIEDFVSILFVPLVSRRAQRLPLCE